MPKDQFFGSTDNDYNFSSSEEFGSIQEAVDYYNNELEEGAEFFVGKGDRFTVRELYDIDWLLENMREQAQERAGEAADDYLYNMPKADMDELSDLIAKWFDKKGYGPNFYGVTDIQKFIATKNK